MNTEATSNAYTPISSTHTTSTQVQDSIIPVITNLPGIGSKACVIANYIIAVYIEDLKEIRLYEYGKGAYDKSLPCQYPVKEIFVNGRHLIVKYENDHNSMQIWDWYTKKEISIPSTWKRVSSIFFPFPFCIHVEKEKFDNKTVSLIVSKSENYEYIQTIHTIAFKINDMLMSRDILYIIGLSTNPLSRAPQKGMLMIIERVGTPNYIIYKQTFDYNAFSHSDSIKEDQGFVYMPRNEHPVSFAWDSKTYSTVMAKEGQGSLVANVGYTLATAYSNEIAIYNVDEENNTRLPSGGTRVKKELEFTQTDQSKHLGKAKIIEVTQNNPLTALHLFKQDQCKWMAEGYQDGVVFIRNLETYTRMMEFHPLPNMGKVISCTTFYASNKMLVQYEKPSEEGHCAIVWDLIKQTPFLFVGSKALKGKSNMEGVFFQFVWGSIVLQYGNEVLYYKDAMHSI